MTIVYFFFFKQKTAYEMRISDWSSDVCSSDLGGQAAARDVVFDQQEMPRPAPHAVVAQALEVDAVAGSQAEPGNVLGVGEQHAALAEHAAVAVVQDVDRGVVLVVRAHGCQREYRLLARRAGARSEEHTSDHQA